MPSEREQRDPFLWRAEPRSRGGAGCRCWIALVRQSVGRAGRGIRIRSGVGARLERSSRSRVCASKEPLVKFRLHLSDEEQLRRFAGASVCPLKSWKLTEEDWRNRERRGKYEAAVPAMLERTDYDCARWTVISGHSKRCARVAVVEAVIAESNRNARETAGATGDQRPTPHEVDRLSGLARKFAHVSVQAARWWDACGASSLSRTLSRSSRVNFHSNGWAICW